MKNSRQLLKILHDQLNTCSGYLEIQKIKTDALVVGDIKQLDAIVRDEQSFLMKMESFDRKRNQMLLEVQLSHITISDLIANHVEEELKEQYQEVFDKLSNVIDEIRKINALNQRLLKQRITVVNSFLADESKREFISEAEEGYANVFKEKAKRV